MDEMRDFCPHDLFPNTKSDLGPCPHKHSSALKEQFLHDVDHDFYAKKYEREFIDTLQRLVDGVEQRIRKGNERILGPDESRLEHDRQKKVDILKDEMSKLMVLAQEAGEKGNIAEAESYTRKMTQVRCSLDRVNSTSSNFLSSLSAQEKSLRVCPVCGAMQSLGDAASRFESHVTGKQHVGYERIRNTLQKLREKHGLNGSSGTVRQNPHNRSITSVEIDKDSTKKSTNNEGTESELKDEEANQDESKKNDIASPHISSCNASVSRSNDRYKSRARSSRRSSISSSQDYKYDRKKYDSTRYGKSKYKSRKKSHSYDRRRRSYSFRHSDSTSSEKKYTHSRKSSWQLKNSSSYTARKNDVKKKSHYHSNDENRYYSKSKNKLSSKYHYSSSNDSAKDSSYTSEYSSHSHRHHRNHRYERESSHIKSSLVNEYHKEEVNL